MKKDTARANIVLVFVPGGMGSKLALGNDLVWSDGVQEYCSLRMLKNPSMLLPWVPLNSPAALTFYRSFISFLGRRGYAEAKGNLVVWPYDWRISVEETGNKLNSDISSKLSGEFRGKKFIFICHSLGCMVVRWALLCSPGDIRGSVERVIAAAPPGLGIASAFREMVQVTIGSTPLYATILALIKYLSGYNIDIPIIRVSRSITSLLELLPPNFLPILTTGTGNQIGAFDWQGWPDELLALRRSVLARQSTQASPPRNWGQIHRTLIASKQHPTESVYVLNANDSDIVSSLSEDGDDSVTFTSARAYMDLTTLQPVPPLDSEVLVASAHGDLLKEPGAQTEISKFI
jgi:hypothetical protein